MFGIRGTSDCYFQRGRKYGRILRVEKSDVKDYGVMFNVTGQLGGVSSLLLADGFVLVCIPIVRVILIHILQK